MPYAPSGRNRARKEERGGGGECNILKICSNRLSKNMQFA
jgi:hypothetical protein